MIYDALASYYDDLVKDDEATQLWIDFVKKYCPHKKVLELACGSGEISHGLQEEGYSIKATDFSESMISKLKEKYPTVDTAIIDMSNFKYDEKVDGVLCFCDSINYLSSMDEVRSMFQSVRGCLKDDGVFLFDMHSIDRLDEFKELYIEEGVLDVPYQWTIQSDENKIYQHFSFYEEDKILQEQHIQTVFTLDEILPELESLGFECKVITDFNQDGVCEGEKYFIVARRKVC
ncbi:MAG: class I SAM-dependent DNA methyltransferase [Anaerorhabdus sp.]|uniref:class I SAM-dependent DNA methyltransferase n=1 Tax=Anaerorhabdus sp. TaxID=1872524 RepID=UPI003A8525F9